MVTQLSDDVKYRLMVEKWWVAAANEKYFKIQPEGWRTNCSVTLDDLIELEDLIDADFVGIIASQLVLRRR
jgi:hypothetical protein